MTWSVVNTGSTLDWLYFERDKMDLDLIFLLLFYILFSTLRDFWRHKPRKRRKKRNRTKIKNRTRNQGKGKEKEKERGKENEMKVCNLSD